jgi:single-strand DNA-binding protein
MYNKITAVGRLGKDPEAKTGKNNTAYTVFSVATDAYAGKDEGGKPRYETTWFDVTAFRQTGEYVAKNLKKGDTVLVEGKVSARAYEGKAYLQITADTVQVIARGTGSEGQKTASATASASATTVADEDIPF